MEVWCTDGLLSTNIKNMQNAVSINADQSNWTSLNFEFQNSKYCKSQISTSPTNTIFIHADYYQSNYSIRVRSRSRERGDFIQNGKHRWVVLDYTLHLVYETSFDRSSRQIRFSVTCYLRMKHVHWDPKAVCFDFQRQRILISTWWEQSHQGNSTRDKSSLQTVDSVVYVVISETVARQNATTIPLHLCRHRLFYR